MPTALFMAVILSEAKRSIRELISGKLRIEAASRTSSAALQPRLCSELTDDHDFAFKMIWTAAGMSSATQSALLPVTSR